MPPMKQLGDSLGHVTNSHLRSSLLLRTANQQLQATSTSTSQADMYLE
jgi:hypothetical protein